MALLYREPLESNAMKVLSWTKRALMAARKILQRGFCKVERENRLLMSNGGSNSGWCFSAKRTNNMRKYLIGLSAACAACVAFWSASVIAADHNDPPSVTGGSSDDIGDLYAWHYDDNGTQKLVTVLTFAGPKAPIDGQMGEYDREVAYGIHIDDDDDDAESEVEMIIRFGNNSAGEVGIQVSGIPGTEGPVVGAVESVIEAGDVKVFAGLRDDPFFMDLDGFVQTLGTGTLSFDNTNDTFAGQNITAVVIEVPYAAVQDDAGAVLNLWASARRLGE